MIRETGEILWVHGKSGEPWEFQGVYATEQAAIAACKTDREFVGPVVVGEAFPSERIEWPGAYYPLASGDH